MSSAAIADSPSISVVLIDDSKIQHGLMKRMFQQVEGLELVGGATSAEKAVKLIEELKPDILLLDINLPGISGIDFLRRKGARNLPPCIVLSAFVGSSEGLRNKAREAGAVAVISKPTRGDPAEIKEVFDSIQQAIFVAHANRTGQPVQEVNLNTAVPTFGTSGTPSSHPSNTRTGTRPIALDVPIVIGASTGGPSALQDLLKSLPRRHPPIVIGQHMPSTFTLSLAKSLAHETNLAVTEARTGDVLRPNRVFVAPGNRHLRVRSLNGAPTITTIAQLPGCRHHPSIDVLMESVVDSVGGRAIGVLLTGMGRDGARGLLRMRTAGCHTVVQDEASSVVFGMPRAAIQAKAAERVLDIKEIGPALLSWLSELNR